MLQTPKSQAVVSKSQWMRAFKHSQVENLKGLIELLVDLKDIFFADAK